MKPDTREAGFSLIELLIALGVMTMIMGSAFSLLNKFQQDYRYEEAYAEAQRNARFAVSRLNEIVRSAGTNPTGITTVNSASFVVFVDSAGIAMTDTGPISSPSIRLRSDLDGDGLFNTRVSSNSDVIVTSEDVTLKLVNDQLLLIDNTVMGATPVSIAEGISDVAYSDPDGSRRLVQVVLRAKPNEIGAEDPRYREVTYSSTIRVRNR